MIVATGFVLVLVGPLRQLVVYLLLALFFSFAIEPAVNYAHARWRWRRGAATAALFGVVLLLAAVMVGVVMSTVLRGASVIAERIPTAAQDSAAWLANAFGVDVSTSSLESGAREAAAELAAGAGTPLPVLLGFTASLVGGVFALFTVGMFVFYMVADAPRFRRAVLSFFTQERQTELLAVWEGAIAKTGGYFYSKLLLAGINGTLMFVVLLLVGVPGAAALGFFVGLVAAFIPIVGTYIASVVPLLVALMTVGWRGALVVLIYVLVYQQLENYVLAPRILGKTMRLHPAVAFGAAIGGVLWAFLALPFAATIQASASLWIQRHEVVDSALTRIGGSPVVEGAARDESVMRRGLQWVGSTRGWIRAALPGRRHATPADR